ncbi:LacI family transcriptional regulator, partial [Streptomyces cavourensis]|nr:LacI family transcriptional regulator [Streptomyces cavourensis]
VPAGVFQQPRQERQPPGAAAVRQLIAQLSGREHTEPLVACAFRPGTTAGPPPDPAD